MKAKKLVSLLSVTAIALSTVFLSAGCGSSAEASGSEVIIYSNADDEAAEAMKATLDENGYEGQYIFQSFGTSELGGKIIAEGTDIEADVVTMSSYYLDSAQEENEMFATIESESATLEAVPEYYKPVISIEGSIILNTELMEEYDLETPTSIKDLANPEYEGLISVTDITGSSTAWLMVQALVDSYGEEEAQEILAGIYENAGAHLETSGSGPIKKVRAGEVAIGFGLRHQAVADKADGLPIDFVDPEEGNFALSESIAVVDKGEETNELAKEMAECIINNGREGIQANYPIAIYEGESVDSENMSTNPKTYGETLTVELLKQHEELSEAAK